MPDPGFHRTLKLVAIGDQPGDMGCHVIRQWCAQATGTRHCRFDGDVANDCGGVLRFIQRQGRVIRPAQRQKRRQRACPFDGINVALQDGLGRFSGPGGPRSARGSPRADAQEWTWVIGPRGRTQVV